MSEEIRGNNLAMPVGKRGGPRGVEAVVHKLLADDQRPLRERVSSLILKLALAAKLHQSGDLSSLCVCGEPCERRPASGG
jgi:hypothetical protein